MVAPTWSAWVWVATARAVCRSGPRRLLEAGDAHASVDQQVAVAPTHMPDVAAHSGITCGSHSSVMSSSIRRVSNQRSAICKTMVDALPSHARAAWKTSLVLLATSLFWAERAPPVGRWQFGRGICVEGRDSLGRAGDFDQLAQSGSRPARRSACSRSRSARSSPCSRSAWKAAA